MKPIKILHCADIHLGFSFKSLKDNRKSALRIKDIKATFISIINLIKYHKVDLLLIAGDLFDSIEASEREFSFVYQLFNSIPETIIAISPGNHDPISPNSSYMKEKWPPNVHIFKDNFDSILFDSLKLELWGVPFLSQYQTTCMLKLLSPKKTNYIQIGLVHGDIGMQNFASNYHPIPFSKVENLDLDYLALGHIHKMQFPNKIGNTCYAYPGSPEGLGFDETEAKGIFIGEINKNHCSLSFHRTSQRKYIKTSVDISGAEYLSDISDKISSYLKKTYGKNYTRNLYRISLIGEIKDSLFLSIPELLLALDSLFYVEIKDESFLSIDIDSLKAEDSIQGYFTDYILNKSKQPSKVRDKALKLGLKSFFGEVFYHED